MQKHIGTIAEIKFIAKALQYHYNVSVPIGDNLPYDCVVEYEGKLSKIQIKSTCYKITSNRNDCYKIAAGKGSSSKTPYKAQNVDFLVVYIHPLDCWYIIPYDALKAVSVRLYPHRLECEGKYEKYKERWEILSQVGS
tara:strand:- start:455 stop:868 length:414 start_codon:yes stop_codon:yes gene_type:complete